MFDKKTFYICAVAMALIYILGIIAGSSASFPSDAVKVKNLQALSPALSRVAGQDILRAVLPHNMRGFFVMVFGIPSGGIIPARSMFTSGYALGFFAKLAKLQSIPIIVIVMSILPHAILELVSLVLVSALSLYFIFRVYKFFRGMPIRWGKETLTFGKIAVFALGLSILATIVESYATPFLITHLTGR